MGTDTTFRDHMPDIAKQRLAPPGDIESIIAMVEGPSFDMARDGRRIIEEATSRLVSDRSDLTVGPGQPSSPSPS